MTPRLAIVLRDADGSVHEGRCDLPGLPENFTGVMTVHFAEGYPAIVRTPKETAMERRRGERRAETEVKLT
jgi:hypothetical protein